MTMENGHDPLADQAAVAASEQFDNGQAALRIREYRMENGVVLRLKPVPPMLLRAAAVRVRDPEVPMAYIESKGRDEPNPSHPDYLRGLSEAADRRNQAALTVGLLSGTEFVSAPSGIPGPDDDEWIDVIRSTNEVAGDVIDAPDFQLELHIEPGSKARYLDWLRYYAISSETELQTLRWLTTMGVALSEEEVQASASAFRDIYARGAALDIALAASSIDRPDVPAPDPGDGA